MSQEQHGVALATSPAVGWPPDDTEESVLGTNLHQANITNLRWGLNEVAASRVLPGQPPPWQALSQTGISGLRRWDGSPYTVLPDVFVYDHAVDDRRATLALAEEGPPLLIAETLSPSTSRADLDLRHGKGYSYAQAGVREYLILDSTGDDLPEQAQGWRLEGRIYMPWRPDANGRWQSQVIPVAITFEGVRVVVYAGERRQLREGEVAQAVNALEERLAKQGAELARRDAELARRDAELAKLRRLLEERGSEPSSGS